MKTKNKRLIVVLGMHRSGTSAITRGLQVLGVNLGNRMMPPAEGNNPKGFWEDIDLNALNIEMLNAIGGDWNHLAPVSKHDVEILCNKGYFLRAIELLRQKISNAQVFGIKDPRIAKLLPFWKEVFNYCQFDISFVLVVRHPRSVVKSLSNRDGIEAEQSYLLWLGHVVTSLTGSAGDKRVLVDYDRLMQSADRELNRIAKQLDLIINPIDLQNYKIEFLDQGLRHTVYQLEDLSLDDACPQLVHEIYAKLLEVASDCIQIDSPALLQIIKHWANEFERNAVALSLADRFYTQKKSAEQAVAERDGQIASLDQVVHDKDVHIGNIEYLLREQDGQITSLNQAVAERDGQISNLNQAVAERDGQIASLDQVVHDKDVHIGNIEYLLREQDGQITSLNQAVAERDGQITSLNQAVAERDGQISNLNQAVAERDGQISNLNQAVSERNGQIAGLSQAAVERDSVIRHILTSTSWRITRPLRAVKSLFWRNGGSMNAQETSSKHFDAAWYLKRNPDVVMSGMDAYEHYVLFGRNEGRLPRPDSLIKRNIKRLQVVFPLIPSFMNSAGGFFPSVIKVMKVLKQESWSGLARRILILRERSGASVEQNRYAVASYANYIAAMEPNDEDLKAMGAAVTYLGYRPKFSIVVPVYNVEVKWLTCFIQSVLAQVYPDWELCIADDHSTLSHVKPLLESFAAKDPRIRLVFRNVNGHISAATNSALELATGDFVCLMDNDDEIAPHALYEFASLLNRDESIDMIYSDEDKLDIEGNRYEPFFKPDWSPEALEGCMYTAHFACYRMSFVREVGGFRSNFNGAQDYDFVLRFTERAAKIAHIPKVLYHWRAIPGSTAASMDAKDYVLDAAIRALAERAERVAGGGEARMSSYSGSFDLRYKINGSPLVSIVIPSAGRMARVRGGDVDLLAQVVSSIYEHTTYRNFEIIVVDNNDLRPETLEAIKPYICRFVHFEGEFNIATKMNLGAREARGEYLLFMNDDIEVITPDWMECLLQLCQRKGVGVVGAKLHYENNSLQHVGVAFWNGLPDHIHRAFPGTHPGHFFSSVANRNYLAVTGAVLMTKRELFKAVGGFDEEFAINYNDIDYCLKVFREGFRIVFAAGAQLCHYESVSREAVVSPEEIELFQQKWMDVVSYDPYYSAFFDNHPPVFALRHEWSNLSILDAVKSPVVSQH